MLKLKNQKLQGKLSAIVSMREVLKHSSHFRMTGLMNVSGYPQSNHVVGKIQDYIKLTSFEDMLNSILELRNIARLASDVLATIPIARIDRYQMNRTELLAYITQNAEAYGYDSMDTEDYEFVAYLITSSESTETSWLLDFAESKTQNRFLQIAELYKQADSKIEVRIESNKPQVVGSPLAYVYQPDSDAISSLLGAASIRDNVTAWGAAGFPDDSKYRRMVIHSCTIYTLANLRVIDHVACLLTSTDVYDAFITPRKSIDPSANAERARSLKLFAGYLQSLLMYPHIFALELFKQSYDTVQSMYLQFPPLPGSVIAQYDAAVHSYDTLDARQDVTKLINSWHTKGLDDSNITVLASETTTLFGIEDAYQKALDATAGSTTPIKFTELAALNDTAYNPYMLAHPVATLDMFLDMTKALFMGDVMKKLIREAATSMLPAIPLYLNEEIVDGLKRSNFVIPFGFCQPLPISGDINVTSYPRFEGGTFSYRTLAPRHAYDYRYHMRREAVNTIFKLSTYTNSGSDYLPKLGINIMSAMRLRSILDCQWKTLYPTQIMNGEFVYTKELVQSNEEVKRRLFETLTNTQYALIERTIGNPEISLTYATVLSSCGILWRKPPVTTKAKAGTATSAAANTYSLIQGYGQPYGTTYRNLADKQGDYAAEDYIHISDEVAFTFLKKIPMPTRDLVAAVDFYLGHPYYYFASNSETFDVKEWVLGDSLMNFSLFPLPDKVDAPRLLLDRKRAFLNDELYAQLNLLYLLPDQGDSNFSVSFPLKANNWRHDKLVYWLEYIGFTYGPSTRDVAGSGEATAINTLITQAEQSIKEVEKNSPASADNKPNPNAVPNNVQITDLNEKEGKSEGGKKHGGKNNGPKKEDEKKDEPKKESKFGKASDLKKEEEKEKDEKKGKKDEKDLEEEK